MVREGSPHWGAQSTAMVKEKDDVLSLEIDPSEPESHVKVGDCDTDHKRWPSGVRILGRYCG